MEDKNNFKVLHIGSSKDKGGTYTNTRTLEEFDDKPTLKEMQSWTDSGVIEVLTVMHEGEECHAIIDEEGKFNTNNEINGMATHKWWTYLRGNGFAWGQDMIVGNCTVLLNFELE